MEHIVQIELFYREHKERTEINVIEKQKQSIILEILWLVCHNPEINWKTRKVKITRCSDECEKQQKAKQIKPRWQKQKEKEQKKKKKEFRKLIVEEKIEIARMIEEKQKEEEDLIKIRMVEEIVPRRFYKYLKMFKKKELEIMLTRKT